MNGDFVRPTKHISNDERTYAQPVPGSIADRVVNEFDRLKEHNQATVSDIREGRILVAEMEEVRAHNNNVGPHDQRLEVKYDVPTNSLSVRFENRNTSLATEVVSTATPPAYSEPEARQDYYDRHVNLNVFEDRPSPAPSDVASSALSDAPSPSVGASSPPVAGSPSSAVQTPPFNAHSALDQYSTKSLINID